MRYRLALALGRTLGEIALMPQAEYLGWVEYYQVEPWGSHFDDVRAGQIAAVVANANRDPARTPTPFKPLDFAPWNNTGLLDREAEAEGAHANDPAAAAAAIRDLLAQIQPKDPPI